MHYMRTVVAAALVAASTSAFAGQITGAGSSFIYPVMSKWASVFKKEASIDVNYQSIGSSAGIKQVEARTVTFAATDAPLKIEQLNKSGLVQWPMIMGAIVPVINVEGVKAGDLVFDGPTLAQIFLGRITKWDDPAIKKLNPNITLPSAAISVTHRSDGSGTTFNFTNYLSKVSADWKTKIGEGTGVEWPIGVGAKGNEGVAANVGQTKNSIGYVEYAYAKQNKLTYTALINKAGKTVQPTNETFRSAAANADWTNAPGFYLILTDQPGEMSWPIIASTFVLMHKQPADKAASADAIKFFRWSLEHGDKMAEELDYVPMPDNVIKLIEKVWSEIKM
jgi:phosphate transport system substrate-binding protein